MKEGRKDGRVLFDNTIIYNNYLSHKGHLFSSQYIFAA